VAIVLTLLAVFVILVANELWWRKRSVHGELSRKFVHITVGSFVAFWPFYLSWHEIELLSIAFFIVVGASKYLKLFQAIHSVQRPTAGELMFAVSIGVIALLTHDEWIYAASLMQMAWADGMAAVIGVQYGAPTSYRIFNHTKSVVGTLTFFIVSYIVLLIFNNAGGLGIQPYWLVLASALGSIFENLAVWGLDNLAVPLVVALVLIHH
jgi:phytol kinase